MSAIHGRGGLMPPIPSFLAKDSSTAASKQSLSSQSHPAASVSPQKFGIRYGTPALVLFYVAKDGGKGQTRQRCMPLRNAGQLTVEEIVDALRDRHGKYLRAVKVEQLRRLVKLVQKHAKDAKPKSFPIPAPQQVGKPAVETVIKDTAGASLPRSSLLLPLPSKTAGEGAKPYASSVAGTIAPSTSTASPVSAVAQTQPATDDSVSVGTSEDVKKDIKPPPLGRDRNAMQKAPAGLAPLPLVKSPQPAAAGLVVDGTKDLNKVSEDELKRVKQAMNADFEKNRLKPGDEGFAYDIQKSFGPPTDANDWDEDSDISPPKPASLTAAHQYEDNNSLDDLPDDLSHNDDGLPTSNIAAAATTATAKAWLRNTPGTTATNPFSNAAVESGGKGAWTVGPESVESPEISYDEDVGIEAEIQKIEREEKECGAKGEVAKGKDEDGNAGGRFQPPSAAAGSGMSKLAPISGSIGAGGLAPLGAAPNDAELKPLGGSSVAGLAPIRIVPALGKTVNDDASPVNLGKFAAAPVVSATTPAPVSALTGPDDNAAGEKDFVDEVSEDIEEYILESDGDADADDNKDDQPAVIIPPKAVSLAKPDSMSAKTQPTPSSSSLGGLPPLQGMTGKPGAKPLQESSNPQNDDENDYDDDDFGAGHTDDEVVSGGGGDEEQDEDDKILVDDGSGDDDEDGEIVFSDDGLSYDEKDDDGGFL
ncbi:hypothetical protein HDU86_003520 [Geranomyces michiganensis]|nr:hypothetical protein HDU86_003520 [Geranomyces michiganensis]